MQLYLVFFTWLSLYSLHRTKSQLVLQVKFILTESPLHVCHEKLLFNAVFDFNHFIFFNCSCWCWWCLLLWSTQQFSYLFKAHTFWKKIVFSNPAINRETSVKHRCWRSTLCRFKDFRKDRLNVTRGWPDIGPPFDTWYSSKRKELSVPTRP